MPAHLRKQYRYEPGQFITIRVQDGDSFIKRSYSMSSSPDMDSFLQITIKRAGYISSRLLDTVKEGDELLVLPPEGSFFIKPTKRPRHYLLFAGGSGITPIYSILKSVLATRPESKVTLIYTNHDEASIIFKEPLDTLEHMYRERLSIVHILSNPSVSWAGRKGRPVANTINELLEELLASSKMDTEYYVCGPGGYMDLVEMVLRARNISAEKIHSERFTFAGSSVDTPNSYDKPEKPLEVGDPLRGDGGVPQKLTVELKGTIREIDCKANETILDAVLRAGMEPPFACQEGVCASCKAALKQGRVRMEHHDALTPLEVDQRNILTCTAIAVSKETIVSFDE